PGVGYRNLMVWSGGNPDFSATPPHDITGKPSAPHFPTGPGAGEIARLMRLSRQCLADHPINRDRRARGLKPANSIWLWGQGRAPQMVKIADRFNIRGGVISAVDLLNGIGVYAGLKVIRVAGATGYIDTDYAGKAREALRALGELDLVFVHVEAPDEMGHEGNLRGKVRSIEDFDEKVIGTVLNGMDHLGPMRIAVLSDHPTPISTMTHASDPSPFAVLSSVREENQGLGGTFGESAAKRSGNLVSPGYQFMDLFIGDWRRFVENKTR
ncbi:MAG: phosphoglycerate mutase, partial [Deltaproteobacteria bacterium]|nr:phosphoglycerate mutase [Deltaproteobacteria bacterium]